MSVFGGLWEIVASLSIVSQVFILAIAALWLFFNLRYSARVVELGPTILTTLGIFGTFLGVALGLSHFDTGNVQASVPALLTGLKTAFWASVFGVGAAVQLKMREFLVDAFSKKKKVTGQSLSPLAVSGRYPGGAGRLRRCLAAATDKDAAPGYGRQAGGRNRRQSPRDGR